MPRTPDGTEYDLTGPEAAPVVVLVHGLGLTRAVWQWLVPELGGCRVLAYDLAGHGASAPPAAPSLRGLSDQLAALMDHCGIPCAAVVGFSLGGMVARRFAQDHRARVWALGVLHSAHARDAAAQAAIAARVAQAREHGPQATVAAALERWFTDGFRAARPDIIAQVRAWVLGNDPAVYPGLYAILADGVAEIVAPVPPLTLPALVLTADQDHGNSPAMSRAIAAEIAGAELVILPGLRHMALAEAPEAVNAPLIDFLHRHAVTVRPPGGERRGPC